LNTDALKYSWEQAAKSGDDVPLYFYSHLFLSHPELRAMFPVSMAAQRDKLVGALGKVVSNVDELDQVIGLIQQLGRDHRRFNVIPEHYNAVGASLLATLKQFLGAAWTDELASDWAAAYGVIARTMVEAAEDSSETTPAWWDAEVISTERRTMDVTVVHLHPEQRYEYSPGQSFAMEIPQRPRLWRYFSPANAPRDDGTLELHVQLVDGGQMSGALVRSLRSGDNVKLGAPVGDQLTRPSGDGQDLLLVGGGTGIAPLRAIVEQVDREWREQGSGPQVHLFHGARVPWNLYDREELTGLAQTRDWFEYIEVVSHDSSFPRARGLVGSVAARHQSWQGWSARVCGGPEMVSHTVGELNAAGLHADDIRFENFHHVGAGDTDDVSNSGDQE
jgi:NAD(P)H-flavin reductase/hemoglobin-like flavoprotein